MSCRFSRCSVAPGYDCPAHASYCICFEKVGVRKTKSLSNLPVCLERKVASSRSVGVFKQEELNCGRPIDDNFQCSSLESSSASLDCPSECSCDGSENKFIFKIKFVT